MAYWAPSLLLPLVPITHPQANYSDPTTNPNMVSNAMLATPPPNRSRRALNAQMNHFKLNQDRLNAQMNQKLNQDRLTAQIALFSTTPSSTSSSSSSSSSRPPPSTHYPFFRGLLSNRLHHRFSLSPLFSLLKTLCLVEDASRFFKFCLIGYI